MSDIVGRASRLGFATLLALAACTVIAGTDPTIDQSNTTVSIDGYHSIQFFSPIGQSFTPTLGSLDFVQILTKDFCTGSPTPPDCPGSPTTLQIAIFSGIFSGPALGKSEPLILPAGFEGLSTFHFSSPVGLTPGGLYSFEVSILSGNNWGLGSGFNSTYAAGDMVLGGLPVSPRDLWFAEGTTGPQPTSIPALSNWGLIVMSTLLGGLAVARVRSRVRHRTLRSHGRV